MTSDHVQSVTLRWPRNARPSKGDGPGSRRHPSRLASLAPQDDGVHTSEPHLAQPVKPPPSFDFHISFKSASS